MKILLILSLLFSHIHFGGEVVKTPIIYVTDLFHPHGDPDDNFDLATLYAIPNIEVRGIVLDQGATQTISPGSSIIDQINYLSGRNVPYAVGLSDPLTSLADTGASQGAEYQGAVDMILSQLAASSTKVNLVTVGSMRDIAAAYNRNNQLFIDKVDKIMVFAGEATANYQEFNVAYDPNAYVDIMRSGLNIYWVPCFDGGLFTNNGNASYFLVPLQSSLLAGISDKLLQYFIYSLLDKTSDPISFLTSAVDVTEKATIYAQARNLWVVNILESLTGTYDQTLYDYSSVNVSFNSSGIASYNQGDSKTMKRFFIVDTPNYTSRMTTATNTLLRKFPLTITTANFLSPKAYIDNMFNGVMGQAIRPYPVS